MLVKIEILDGEKVLESYTAPDGSWIQTDTIGAQHLPATLEVREWEQYASGYGWKKAVKVRFTPISPPKIPAKILALLNSHDKQWGRNGYEWMGSHRERQGGTVLNRVRELAWYPYKIRDLSPLADDPEVKEFLETLGKRE